MFELDGRALWVSLHCGPASTPNGLRVTKAIAMSVLGGASPDPVGERVNVIEGVGTLCQARLRRCLRETTSTLPKGNRLTLGMDRARRPS